MEEMTIEEYQEAIQSGKAGNKYNARQSRCNKNHLHDSGAEALRCNELQLEVLAGTITKLKQQPKFVILKKFVDGQGHKIRGITYRADFSYSVPDGDMRIVEDVKGCLTNVYKLKKKLFLNKIKNKNIVFVETV